MSYKRIFLSRQMSLSYGRVCLFLQNTLIKIYFPSKNKIVHHLLTTNLGYYGLKNIRYCKKKKIVV